MLNSYKKFLETYQNHKRSLKALKQDLSRAQSKLSEKDYKSAIAIVDDFEKFMEEKKIHTEKWMEIYANDGISELNRWYKINFNKIREIVSK